MKADQPEYRVQLDVFSGPLDLLLYLIRREELDIQDIPIARITEQYLNYVRLLEEIDPDAAGEFLVLASTLIEIKSGALLPTPPGESPEEPFDPRAGLVRQLLEYSRFKDAAEHLRQAAQQRQARFVRRPADLPPQLRGVELEEAQVWDLLEAFGRVMTSIGQGPARHEIRYDETPIEVYAEQILAVVRARGVVEFTALFDGYVRRAELVGRFLALLELVRAGSVRAEQARNFGAIYIFAVEHRAIDQAQEPHSDTEFASNAVEPAATVQPAADGDQQP